MKLPFRHIVCLGCFLCFVSISCEEVFAQKAEIHGYIYNANTGEALPYATVNIHNTTTGTTTNEDGYYSLEIDTTNIQLRFAYLSFQDTLITVHLHNVQKMRKDVYLQPDTFYMNEVIVSANRVAKKVQKLAQIRNEQKEGLKSFQATVYKLAILSSIPEHKTEEIENADPIAFSERHSVIYYTSSPERFTEQIEAHHASENFFSEYDFFSTGGGPLNLNQEEVSVSILSEALTVVGPVSENAGEFYDLYEQKADSSWPEGTTEIFFKPLVKNRPLFKGKIWVNEKNESILGMDVSLNEYAQTNTGTFSITDISYKQNYIEIDEFWLPAKTELSAEINFIGSKNTILYKDEWTWSNHRINSEAAESHQVNLSTTHIIPEADNRNRTYWQNLKIRSQNSNFEKLDEAKAFKEDRKVLLAYMKAFRTIFKLPVWLQRSHFTNFSDFYHFNRVEGHFLGAGVRTPKHRDFEYRGSAGYGFGNESLSYQFRAYHFPGNSFVAPEFAYRKETVPQYQDYEYNRTPVDFFEAQQSFNALFSGGTGINYIERAGFEAGFRFRFGVESFLRLLYVKEHHQSLKTSTSYNLIGNDFNTIRLSNNDPVYPAQNGDQEGLYVHLHHDTRQYQHTQFLRDYNIRRFGWLSDIILEKGIDEWGSDFNFNRYRVGLKFYWPVFTSHFFQTDITFGAADAGTPHQRMFSYNGFVVDDYVRYRPFNTINYREPIGYRVSEIRIRYKFGTSLTRKLPIDFLAKSGIKISTFATVGVIDENPSLIPLLPYSKSHTQAEIGIAVSRIFGFFYTEFSKRLYGDYGNSIGFTARF